jgi:hypothetical protein
MTVQDEAMIRTRGEELIARGERMIQLLERGTPGVPWTVGDIVTAEPSLGYTAMLVQRVYIREPGVCEIELIHIEPVAVDVDTLFIEAKWNLETNSWEQVGTQWPIPISEPVANISNDIKIEEAKREKSLAELRQTYPDADIHFNLAADEVALTRWIAENQ